MDIQSLHNIFLQSTGISTDTRNISKGNIFVALKGENFNGNTYAIKALEEGASYAIIDEDITDRNDNTILVENCLETLQKLANYHRKQSNAKVISLTGSNGKTTTKELIHSVLKTHYKTIATKGNLNNHIGVPLSLLTIQEDTEYAIIEMGANHQKEIELLCAIAEPDFGYITNFGKAHLEGFGGFEGVIKGKSELYNYLIPAGKHIFFNQDDAIQVEKLQDYANKTAFSFSNASSDYNFKLETNNEHLSLQNNQNSYPSQLTGLYNATNIAVAITIGNYFKVPEEKIKKGIELYTPTNNRSQIIQQGSNKLFLDAYNANPTSMKAALENLTKNPAKQRYAIIGDMLELGLTAPEEHQGIIDTAKELKIDNLITVGKLFYNCNGQNEKFENFEDLKNYLSENNRIENSTILIKGSRGMRMERLLDIL